MTSEHQEQQEQAGTGPARRAVLKGMTAAAAGSLSARGLYEVLGDFVRPTAANAAPPTVVRRLQEQYLVERIEVVVDNGIAVAIPPIYNDVFTARLKGSVSWTAAALKAAKIRVENALLAVEKPYTATASGLTLVIGWGLPYFRTFTPGLMNTYLPAIPNTSPKQFAVLDAIRFPSDPADLVLEDNHVMFKFRSDSQSIIQGAERALFENPSSGAYIGDLFDLTSKRVGFLGRGFNQPSAAKKLALAAGIPGAAQIPDRSQLMMGFTSTQTNALAPDNLPSFETLRGITNQWPGGYFAAGCAMHLSHLYLDLEQWYGQPYSSRVGQMFSPHTTVPTSDSTVTISNGPGDVATMSQVTNEAASGQTGHNSLLQQATRLSADVLDNYGRLRRKGTAVPLREDFSTIDDPFAWTPAEGTTATYAAGMHFVAFVPGHHLFHRARMAMDGHMPNGTTLGPSPGDTGINGVMRASHRQNYVIPPRKNRALPLVELLS